MPGNQQSRQCQEDRVLIRGKLRRQQPETAPGRLMLRWVITLDALFCSNALTATSEIKVINAFRKPLMRICCRKLDDQS